MLERQQKASKELGQAVPPLYPQQLLGDELLDGAPGGKDARGQLAPGDKLGCQGTARWGCAQAVL